MNILRSKARRQSCSFHTPDDARYAHHRLPQRFVVTALLCRRVFLTRVGGGIIGRSARTLPWCTLSIGVGNLIQLGGLGTGLALLYWAARERPPRSTRLLLASWLVTYFCNHAIAHWAVGRLVGIRFVGYSLHGTTAPAWYPPGVRWVFGHLPFLSARTDPASLRAAGPLPRLLMYLAGPLCTLLTGLGIPVYGRVRGIARAETLLIGANVWFTPMLIVESIRPGGDIQRAWRELCRLRDQGR